MKCDIPNFQSFGSFEKLSFEAGAFLIKNQNRTTGRRSRQWATPPAAAADSFPACIFAPSTAKRASVD